MTPPKYSSQAYWERRYNDEEEGYRHQQDVLRESDAVARLRSQLSDKELDLIEMQQSYERLMRMTEETRDLLKQTHEEKDEYRKHEAIAEQLKIRNDTLQLKIDRKCLVTTIIIC